MNANELKQLIVKANRTELCAALKPLDEEERAALFQDVQQIYLTVDAGSFLEPDDAKPIGLEDEPWFDAAFLKKLRKTSYSDWRVPRMACGLLFLAVTDLKSLRDPYKLGIKGWLHSDLADMPQRVLQVLDDRRPPWLAEFVRRDVKEEFPIISWSVERGLIRAGAQPEDDSDAYVKRMADEHKVYQHDAIEITTDNLKAVPSSLEEYLLSDPEIPARLVWKLFEVDTSAFTYAHSPWFKALTSLCKQGTLDRSRLLEASVSGMSRPFRPSVVSGYGKFHEGLEPTIEERERLVDEYLVALGSEHSTVVGSSLTALERLLKAKKLRADRFLDCVAGAFRISKKAQPAKAIKLLQTLVKQQPDAAPRATEALVVALEHERPDVQETAIDALEKLREYFTKKTQTDLGDSSVAAALKGRLKKLQNTSAAESQTGRSDNPKKEAGMPTRSESTSPLRELKLRVNKLPAEIRSSAGVDAAMTMVDNGERPHVVVIDPRTVPRRDRENRVEPIASLEELIDTVARVIEQVEDAMDVECILDGISRFHMERPDDFDKRVAPLRKRIDILSEPYSQSVIDRGLQIGFSQLLTRWLGMPRLYERRSGWDDMSGLCFRLRAAEVQERIRQKEVGCRLALPTHRNGWLDPVELVERIKRDYVGQRETTDDIDLAQAVLRLTPDGRDDALEALSDLSGDRHTQKLYGGGASLRYALGADTTLDDSRYPWVLRNTTAAIHARRFAADPELSFEPPIPLAIASSADDFSIRIDGPFRHDLSLPAELCVHVNSLENDGWPAFHLSGWRGQLESLVCPINPQPMLMMGWLDHVCDVDFTWTREAARIAVFATSLESKDIRLRVTDALIDCVAQVRLRPELVGEQIALLREGLIIKRTADVLAEVARVSTLHQSSVCGMIDAFISRLSEPPKDLHYLLTPMLEAALESGTELSEPARVVLQTIKGSSKTAKLAKQLLEVEPDRTKQLIARVEATVATVERAERWQRIASEAAPK